MQVFPFDDVTAEAVALVKPRVAKRNFFIYLAQQVTKYPFDFLCSHLFAIIL